MQLDRPAAEAAMDRLAERARHSTRRRPPRRHLPHRRRDDGRRGARPRHRSRRRPSRPAAAGLRRRGAGARLRGRRAAAEHRGDLPAAGQRALGLRHAGDAGAARSGAQRARPARRARLGRGRPAVERDDATRRWRRWAKPAATPSGAPDASAPTCATSASRTRSASPSSAIPREGRDIEMIRDASSRPPISRSTASIPRTCRSRSSAGG